MAQLEEIFWGIALGIAGFLVGYLIGLRLRVA